MKLTVIPSDNTIILNGRVLVFPFAAPANLHAIQWNGTFGFIETTDSKQVRTNAIADVQPFIDAFAAESTRLLAIANTPKTLTEVKATKLASLEQARDAAERANVTVAGKVYSGSEAFQAKVSRTINQTGRGKPIAGAADAWRTADALPVVMTATLLGLIEDAISTQGAAAWARFWLRFDAVQAASTNATVEAVVW